MLSVVIGEGGKHPSKYALLTKGDSEEIVLNFCSAIYIYIAGAIKFNPNVRSDPMGFAQAFIKDIIAELLNNYENEIMRFLVNASFDISGAESAIKESITKISDKWKAGKSEFKLDSFPLDLEVDLKNLGISTGGEAE